MGIFDYGNVQNNACLTCVPEIEIGDYAIVHVGFAISILNEEEARKSFEAWEELIRCAEDEGDGRVD